MQELFVDKIHFFKFLSMSGNQRLYQLEIISSSRSTVQVSLKTPYVENKYKVSPTYQAR